MPQIPLHISSLVSSPQPSTTNPLPSVLHTPSGLAIVEIQGTIHFPDSSASETSIGKLVFPHYDASAADKSDTKWMKRVYLYVGKHQRLTGEVKKLGKPFAIIRRKDGDDRERQDVMEGIEGSGDTPGEELEIMDVIKYKIVFSTRPEPVGGEQEG